MKISNKFTVFIKKLKFILQSHKNNPVYNFFLYALIIITVIFAFIIYHNSFNPTYTEWYAGLAMRTAGQGYNTIEINNSNNLNNYYKIYYQSRSYPSNLFIKDEFLFQMANSLDIEPIALVPYYNPSAHMFSSFRNVFYSDKPPGESFILALFYYFFGYYGFRLAFSVIGSCLFILFFLVADEILKNKLLAYFIAILFVFNEFIISQIFLVQGDLISLFITLLFIYSILLSFKKNNKYLFLISGMISGFLFGTRDYLVLLLLPVFALLTIVSKDKFYNNIKKLRSSKIKIKNLINLVTLFEQPIYVMIGFLLITSQFLYYSYYLNENIILAHAGYGKGKSPDFFNIQNFYKLRPNLIYVGMENAFPSPFYYFINLLILFGFIIGSFVPFGIIYMFKKNRNYAFLLVSWFLIIFIFLSYYGAPDKEVIRLFMPIFFIPLIFFIHGVISFLKSDFYEINKKIFISFFIFLILILFTKSFTSLHFENDEIYTKIMGEGNVKNIRKDLVGQISFYPKFLGLEFQKFNIFDFLSKITFRNKIDNTIFDNVVDLVNYTEKNSIIITTMNGHTMDYIRQFSRRYSSTINVGHNSLCNNNFFSNDCENGYVLFEKSILYLYDKTFPIYYLDFPCSRPIDCNMKQEVEKKLNSSFTFKLADSIDNIKIFKLIKVQVGMMHS